MLSITFYRYIQEQPAKLHGYMNQVILRKESPVNMIQINLESKITMQPKSIFQLKNPHPQRGKT